MTSPDAGTTVSLHRQLEQLGLTDRQARVLVALLRTGEGTSAQLAEVAGVQRTSIYRVLSDLTEQGLIHTVPMKRPTVWASHGWDAVLDALDRAAHDQLDLHRARASRLRHSLTSGQPSTG